MNTQGKKQQNRIKIIGHLPDLINESDYYAPPEKKKVRVRIAVTKDGVDVLGDSMYPVLIENLLQEVSEEDIERMLCG